MNSGFASFNYVFWMKIIWMDVLSEPYVHENVPKRILHELGPIPNLTEHSNMIPVMFTLDVGQAHRLCKKSKVGFHSLHYPLPFGVVVCDVFFSRVIFFTMHQILPSGFNIV